MFVGLFDLADQLVNAADQLRIPGREGPRSQRSIFPHDDKALAVVLDLVEQPGVDPVHRLGVLPGRCRERIQTDDRLRPLLPVRIERLAVGLLHVGDGEQQIGDVGMLGDGIAFLAVPVLADEQLAFKCVHGGVGHPSDEQILKFFDLEILGAVHFLQVQVRPFAVAGPDKLDRLEDVQQDPAFERIDQQLIELVVVGRGDQPVQLVDLERIDRLRQQHLFELSALVGGGLRFIGSFDGGLVDVLEYDVLDAQHLGFDRGHQDLVVEDLGQDLIVKVGVRCAASEIHRGE